MKKKIMKFKCKLIILPNEIFKNTTKYGIILIVKGGMIMKKSFSNLFFIFTFMLLLSLTGCNGRGKISMDELRKLQSEITNKLEEYADYRNFSSCGVDEEKKVVIVELVDNSEEEQKWFKENINNSKYIQFEQGGPYTTFQFNFYITKPENHNSIKFNNYYDEKDGKIYMAGNIGEFYVIDEYQTRYTLKKYISILNQKFDDTIKSITEQMTKVSTLRDGGTTTYKSKEKDISIIVCNTIDGNKDIYIGDYSMEYEQDMCK